MILSDSRIADPARAYRPTSSSPIVVKRSSHIVHIAAFHDRALFPGIPLVSTYLDVECTVGLESCC